MLPDFVIAGPPRSSTTSLWDALRQHPEVFMSAAKEPHYFLMRSRTQPYQGPPDDVWTRTLEDYQTLFREATPDQLKGEASTLYLWSESAAKNMAELAPDVKIICVLRDPIDRAWSHYLLHRFQDKEDLEFAAALSAEAQRRDQEWSPMWRYRELGLYGQQIANYRDLFPRNQLLPLLYDDVRADFPATVSEVLRFLDVDPEAPLDLGTRWNVAGRVRYPRIQRGIDKNRQALKTLLRPLPVRTRQRLRAAVQHRMVTREELGDTSTRESLREYYREDTRRCAELIERDLSSWLGA